MPPEEAISPAELATAAPARLGRVDTVRPSELVASREAPVETVPTPVSKPPSVPSAETVAAPEVPEVAAPRRAVRLVAKAVVSEEEKLATRRERREREQAAAEAAKRPALEKKLASMHDATDMLRVMDTEMALRRAQRMQGDSSNSRQALRVLTICALFALLIAALGAMSWMQDRLARTGFSRHRVEAVEKK